MCRYRNYTSLYMLSLLAIFAISCDDNGAVGTLDADSGTGEAYHTGPSAPFSSPWPLSNSGDYEHGFPAETLTLDCDPTAFPNLSPGLLRETSQALIYGRLTAVEIPEGDPANNGVCEGNRWDGLRLVLEVLHTSGPYAPQVGSEAHIYFPSDQLQAWTRRPIWDAAGGTSHWSDWSEDSPQPVPIIGGEVLISSFPVYVTDEQDEHLLKADLVFSVSSSGNVVAQVDQRGECSVRLEVDGEVPTDYGQVDDLLKVIGEADLTEDEQLFLSERGAFRPSRSYADWVICDDDSI